MSKILSDAFSIYDFHNFHNHVASDFDFKKYVDIWHLIENLILSEKIYLVEESINDFNLDEVFNKFNNEIELINNNQLTTEHLSTFKETNDLKERGFAYSQIAHSKEIYFSPHPFRQELLNSDLIEKSFRISKVIIERFDQNFCTSEDGEFSSVNISVPPLVEHVVEHSKINRHTLYDSICEIRNSKNAMTFREYCINIDNELSERAPRKRIGIINSLFKDIETITNRMHSDFQEGFHTKQRKLNLTKTPVIGKAFEMLDIENVQYRDPIVRHNHPYFFFINDLYNR